MKIKYPRADLFVHKWLLFLGLTVNIPDQAIRLKSLARRKNGGVPHR